MTNLILIPLTYAREGVKFPAKCVYCGKPQETIAPIATYYRSSNKYNPINVTLNVPYCEEHANASRRYGTWLMIFVIGSVIFFFGLQMLISFWLNLQDTFQICILGPGIALLIAFLVGNLGVRKFWSSLNPVVRDLPPPLTDGGLGIRMNTGAKDVGISFANDTMAEEFARLNNLTVQYPKE